MFNISDGSNFFAILIGIDYYFPNIIPGGGSYPSLGGCVRDINHVQDFLLQNIQISKDNIIKLTSSRNDLGNGPLEIPEKLPTYNNIVKAFETITEKANKGNQIYVHYSGHGGRTITTIPKIKGPNGLDEALVPTDIGNTSIPYLRDTEMAVIIKRMLEKKLIITMVLDCCHSGGATKGNGGAATRGIDIIDTTLRPQESAVSSLQDIENTWKSFSNLSYDIPDQYNNSSNSVTKNIQVASGGGYCWLPQINNYVLLAACRPSESAYEYAFEGNERNGALTYWLLKSLSQLDKGITFKHIHDRIIAKIHSQFPQQTPMLQGDGNRQIFGNNYIKTVYAVNVLRVDENNNNTRILLNAGQVHGIRKHVKFAIYPNGLNDYSKIEKRLGIVEVDERGSTNSWANVIAKFDNGDIESGSQAILIDPVDIHLKKKINLVYPDESNSDSLIIKNQLEAIEILKDSIEKNSKDSFLELSNQANNKADFQVAVNNKNEYEIWDPAGNPIPYLNPSIKINDKNSTNSIIERLVHLSKYLNIQQIDNLDIASPLSRKLEIDLFGVEDDYDPADKPDLKPLEFENNIKKVKVGQQMMLRIRNKLPKESNKVLNITILDLQPDWGITQIYPSNPGENFIPIDPDSEQYFPLGVTLPNGYDYGKDLIKVFATLDPTDFHWLELPSLNQPQTIQNKSLRSNINMSPLEQLMATLTKDKPSTRHINPSMTPSKEWTTTQIEIHVEA